jgi:uncharacterized OB-fold protein
MADRRTISGPHPNPETVPYWEAARNSKLLIKKCNACGELHFYPRTLCPFCFSDRTVWHEVSGRGTIYSFSVMRRTSAPYALAYVTLEEGPSMMTNIIGGDLDAIRIGQQVKLVFETADNGQPVPMFTPG